MPKRFFDTLFGKKFKSGSKDEHSHSEERGKFMPEPEVPIDEKFMINFKSNGGKFLYCEDEKELKQVFGEILQENDWKEKAYCTNEELENLFKDFKLNFKADVKEASFALLDCEFLVANTGSLLLTSNQIGEKKLSQLPYNCIVMAKTSQIVDTPSDGLRIINKRKKHIPTNITTIKNFKKDTDQDGYFMNYGSVAKNLYLLLLEDF